MGECVQMRDEECYEIRPETCVPAEQAGSMLRDVANESDLRVLYSVPIAELAALGSGIASLVPALRTATISSTANVQGLYQLANAEIGDTLKAAKDGTFWGAMKREDGTSKMAKLKEVDSVASSETVTMPIDPAAVMMAAALFTIEQKLDNIEEMQERILSFLETEKNAQIEADVQTLVGMIRKYKYNWDNEQYLKSSHKLVLDLQRTARKNMLFYQKSVSETLKARQPFVVQAKIKSTLDDLLKKFQYYRLSLYTFSLAAFLEILLSGNFKEEYISEAKAEIDNLSLEYRELFGKCSEYLEKMGNSALEANVLKGAGNAGNAVGKFIGSIPKIKDGPVDEFLQDQGDRLKSGGIDMERNVLKEFAQMSNPETGLFIEKMEDMIRIYNQTTGICFDDENIYLTAV